MDPKDQGNKKGSKATATILVSSGSEDELSDDPFGEQDGVTGHDVNFKSGQFNDDEGRFDMNADHTKTLEEQIDQQMEDEYYRAPKVIDGPSYDEEHERILHMKPGEIQQKDIGTAFLDQKILEGDDEPLDELEQDNIEDMQTQKLIDESHIIVDNDTGKRFVMEDGQKRDLRPSDKGYTIFDDMDEFHGPDSDFEFPWEEERPGNIKQNAWAYTKAYEAHGEQIKTMRYDSDGFMDEQSELEEQVEIKNNLTQDDIEKLNTPHQPIGEPQPQPTPQNQPGRKKIPHQKCSLYPQPLPNPKENILDDKLQEQEEEGDKDFDLTKDQMADLKREMEEFKQNQDKKVETKDTKDTKEPIEAKEALKADEVDVGMVNFDEDIKKEDQNAAQYNEAQEEPGKGDVYQDLIMQHEINAKMEEAVPQLDEEDIEFLLQSRALYGTQYKKLSNGEIYAYRHTQAHESQNKVNILLLHGNLTNSINMEPIMHTLENKGQIIAPCLRGFGFSSYNKKLKSLKDLAKDVNLFMDETYPQIKEYYIFGHNIGANIASYMALLYSEKVKGLILSAPSPPDGIKEDVEVKTIEDLKKFKQKVFLYNMIQNKDKEMYRTILNYYHIEGPSDEVEIGKSLMSMQMQRNFWEMELYQYTVRMKDQLKLIKCPVKLIYGDNETFQYLEEGLDLQMAIGNNCELVSIPHTGQFAHMEDPKRVSGQLFLFVKKTNKNMEWKDQLLEMQQAQEKELIIQKFKKEQEMRPQPLPQPKLFTRGKQNFNFRNSSRSTFNGSLIRESLADMLDFQEDHVFEPLFIGKFA